MKGNNQYASTMAGFLLSGITGAATGIYPSFGMFNYSIFAEATNVSNATLAIQARVHPSASWVTLNTTNFTSNSGVLTQINGPFSDIRAVLNPYISGNFNVAYCARG